MVFIAIFFLVMAVRAQQDYFTLNPKMEEFFKNHSINIPIFTFTMPNFVKNENNTYKAPEENNLGPDATRDRLGYGYVIIIILIVIPLLLVCCKLLSYLFGACLLGAKYNRGIEERKKNFEAVYINAKQPNQGQHTFNVPIGDNTRQKNTSYQKKDQTNVQM